MTITFPNNLYASAVVVICWVIWVDKTSFGGKLLPFWGKAGPAFGQIFLIKQADFLRAHSFMTMVVCRLQSLHHYIPWLPWFGFSMCLLQSL